MRYHTCASRSKLLQDLEDSKGEVTRMHLENAALRKELEIYKTFRTCIEQQNTYRTGKFNLYIVHKFYASFGYIVGYTLLIVNMHKPILV